METHVRIPGWEHFEHQADIGIRGFGWTMAEAFEQAARALSAVILAKPEAVLAAVTVPVMCEAVAPALLLVDWLNALLTEMSARRMVFGHFRVHVEGSRLKGEARGEEIDLARHEPVVEVKAASYLAASVCRNEQGVWVAQCVVDV
jgi:SHS2 domain-containing protein